MAKTLVIIRDLQQVPTLPIAINFTTVRYIDIYVVKIKILVALFSAKIHPSSTIRQVRVRLNIEVHLLLTCDKYIMNTQIIVYRESISIECKIAYIRIEQTSSKVLRGFNLQPIESRSDMRSSPYLFILLIGHGFWKIQCKLPPKTKRFCPLVLK